MLGIIVGLKPGLDRPPWNTLRTLEQLVQRLGQVIDITLHQTVGTHFNFSLKGRGIQRLHHLGHLGQVLRLAGHHQRPIVGRGGHGQFQSRILLAKLSGKHIGNYAGDRNRRTVLDRVNHHLSLGLGRLLIQHSDYLLDQRQLVLVRRDDQPAATGIRQD